MVTQPLVNVAFSSANTTIAAGSLVYGINATSNAVTAGYVLAANQAGANGWLLIAPQSVSSVTINAITFANTVTGSFNVGETVYQSGNTGNVAVGIVSLANSTTVVIDEYLGPFVANTIIHGIASSAGANASSVASYAFTNANFSNASVTAVVLATTRNGAVKGTATDRTATANIMASNTTAIGIYPTSVYPFVPSTKSWVYSSSNNGIVKATVNAVSTGTPGGFKIGAISDSEVIYINTDFIGDNNSNNQPYMGLTINAASYGLPGNTSAGYTSVLSTCLTKAPIAIGTIASLTERNPGLNNTTKPFAVEYEKSIAGFGKPSRIVCHVGNTAGGYTVGEDVTQAVTLPRVTLTIANTTGIFGYSTHETSSKQEATV
jgi:hypothetical protein